MSSISAREKAIRQRLKDDFLHYAPRCLKIRTKAATVVPLVLNDAQMLIHNAIEEQRARTGRVRAILLKGRQQGGSTYVEGRFYWRVTHSKGMRAFILTHDDGATTNLFEMVERYHENCPALVRPTASTSNAKELMFDQLDSGYKVGTAGNKGVGRSSTVQLFHGSEVAFWPNAKGHAAGVLQAVPDEPGTEVVMESTANGLGNFFHLQWQLAESGQSEFIAIFVPWFIQREYRKPVPQGFQITTEEAEYQATYGLDLEQIVWRRAKTVELNNDETLFMQEYPATAAEAFQMAGLDPYIKPKIVMAARKCKLVDEPTGPRHLGVDPARFGDDRTSLCLRQGRKAHWIRSKSKLDTMQVAGWVKTTIEELKLESRLGDRVFIDVGGLGAGVYDRLRETVPDKALLVAVNSSESPFDAVKYTNKRAEMWGEILVWLTNQPASIPDNDELHADLTQIKYSYDSNSALVMEKKADMKKRGLRSPDCADALGLTFARPPVPPKLDDDETKSNFNGGGGWMT
jgi:hypothetical protein